MEVLYDNGYFQVIANPFASEYYVVNKKTGIADSTEESEARALFAADGAKSAIIKHNEKRGEDEAN